MMFSTKEEDLNVTRPFCVYTWPRVPGAAQTGLGDTGAAKVKTRMPESISWHHKYATFTFAGHFLRRRELSLSGRERVALLALRAQAR